MEIKIEYIRLDKLIPYVSNSKLHTESQIASIAGSIKEFGFTNPVLIDDADGIIAGHGRVMAARKLGMTDIPCVRLGHLTKSQKRAYIIADNRLSETGGGWDYETLKNELGAIDWSEINAFSLSDLGSFSFPEIEEKPVLSDDVSDSEPQESRADELQKEWKIGRGQIWKLGNHKIMCGDSGNGEDVAKLLQAEKPDCVFTDPPYGVAIGDKNKFLNTFQKAGRCLENIAGDCMGKDELFSMLVKVFTLVKKHSNSCCAVYVCAPQGGELGLMMMMMMMESGLAVKHVLNWIKKVRHSPWAASIMITNTSLSSIRG